MLKWMSLGILMIAAVVPSGAQDDSGLPDGNGKEIVKKACVACHKVNVITAKRATPAQWANIVQQMVSRGADLTDAEIETVTKYLAASFPAADKPDATPPAAPPATPPTAPQGQMLARYLSAGEWSYGAMPGTR
jgi:mono/diheme cytochrome c family protein